MEGREPAVRMVRCRLVSVTQVTGPRIGCSSCGEDVMGAHACMYVRMCTQTRARTPVGLVTYVSRRPKDVGEEGRL